MLYNNTGNTTGNNKQHMLDLNTTTSTATSSDEKTPVPSPSGYQQQQSSSSSSDGTNTATPIVPVDIFVRHTEPDAVKPTVTRSTSSQSIAEARPSLLARAQLFFQKQLDSITTNVSSVTSPTSSSSTTTTTNSTAGGDVKSTVSTSSSSSSSTSNSSGGKQGDITNTDSDQCHLTSFETDSTSSIASVNSVHRTRSLPPPNARHVIPERMLKITNREKSPYRLMPEVSRNNRQQFLSTSSPASSLGLSSIFFLFVLFICPVFVAKHLQRKTYGNYQGEILSSPLSPVEDSNP